MPDLNTAVVLVRQPRGAVKLNGAVITGWFSWEVDNNAYRAADTFNVTFVTSELPSARDAKWISEQTILTVEIYGTANCAGQYTPVASDSLIFGNVDDVIYDPVGGTVQMSGRDLTATMIDTKSSEHFANQTASQIATTLAARHGLTPVVTATTTKAGDYYQIDHTDVTNEQSEWELLAGLAADEKFDVFVKGHELHFGPKTAITDNYAMIWTPPTNDVATPIADLVSLSLSRSLTIAKGVSVEVHSWNVKQKKGFNAAWPKQAKATKPGQSGETPEVHKYTVPGLTQDQALQKAQALYAQIIAHEMKLSASVPADSVLDCAMSIQLRGTRTAFDQVYYPESVKRSMSMSEGFRMEISAKNKSPDLDDAQ
jgi:phage protein D